MLLFIISFYLHYDLTNCDETISENFNESLIIDKHHQNLLQVNAFLKEHEDLPDAFNPTPQYYPSDFRQGLVHWLPPVLPGFKLPLPPLVIPRPSSPYPMPVFPLKNPGQRPEPPYPGFLIRPMHSMYPGLPPRFLPDYRYQNIYLRPPGPYFPSLSYTPGPARPKRLPFLYEVNLYLQKNPNLINPRRNTISPVISDPAESSKTPPPVAIPSSTIRTSTINYNAKIWLQEIAPYTPSNKKFKDPSKDPSPAHHSVETTVPVTNRMPNINDYWFYNGTVNTGQHFNEDNHGFLYVTLAEKAGIPVQAKDPDMNSMSTMAGDVLHGKITVKKVSNYNSPPPSQSQKQHYLDLMEQLDEGYMMVFMIELCRMIGVKERQEVQDVLHHTEMIYNSLWDNGRLAWIGDPLETVIWKLSIIMSGRDIDLVRTYAAMMFHMLLQRKHTLSEEVNSIIDKADMFYNHEEGNRLFYSLKQFEDYPKTTKNSYWLCDSLIESFLVPFRRLSGTRRRQRLIDSINKALKQRFPLLLKEHNEKILARHATLKNGFQQRKQKKKHDLTHKKKRERKIHRTPEYNNKIMYGTQYSHDIGSRESILRTMAPVSSEQSPRFRAATSKVYRTQQRQPTNANFNLVTRSTGNRNPNHQKTTPFQEKLDSFDRKNYKKTQQTVHRHRFSQKLSTAGHKPPPGAATSTGPKLLASSRFHSPDRSKIAWNYKKSFYHRLKDTLKESEAKNIDKKLKLKAELLIKITESSSYSDDEVSLTRNLNKALKSVNKTDDFVDETR